MLGYFNERKKDKKECQKELQKAEEKCQKAEEKNDEKKRIRRGKLKRKGSKRSARSAPNKKY